MNWIKNLFNIGNSGNVKINKEIESFINNLTLKNMEETHYKYINQYNQHELKIDYNEYRILYRRREGVKFERPVRREVFIIDVNGHEVFFRSEINIINQREYIEAHGEVSDDILKNLYSYCDDVLEGYLDYLK